MLIEMVRERVVRDLFELQIVQNCWPIWRQALALPAKPTAPDILALGDRLSLAFTQTAAAGRQQSTLSNAGTGWEALNCWYLNLCLIGTPSVVFRRKSHAPAAIRDALTVKHGTTATNTESDLVAVTFTASAAGTVLPRWTRAGMQRALDAVAMADFPLMDAAVIQCKTNWNDNAQVPMLWNMVYLNQVNSSTVRRDQRPPRGSVGELPVRVRVAAKQRRGRVQATDACRAAGRHALWRQLSGVTPHSMAWQTT